MIDIPHFEEKKELVKFLVKNKNILIAQKKGVIKHADGIAYGGGVLDVKGNAIKANIALTDIPDVLKVRAVINTTNLFDSHKDVHIPGLWKKSLSENKMIMHIQEHEMKYEKIISEGEDLKAYTKTYTWKELGYDMEGSTEALMFDSNVSKDQNEFMHKQYARGKVKNHSVGMQYVKIVLAINDEDEGAEYEAWEKYFPMIANKEDAQKAGYFWAVTEAKVIEGSAVPLGSNWITPTLENNMKSKPGDHLDKEPQNALIDYDYLISNLKISN